MGPLMLRVTTRTYNAITRQIQPTHRWVHSCWEWQQEHTMQSRGRYSPLTDEYTHAESDNKNIQCKHEADTANSQIGPLMPRVTTRTYSTIEADTANSQMGPLMLRVTTRTYSALEADTAHSQMGPLMPRVTTRTYSALEADTAHSQMGPLMPRVTTRT